MRQVLNTHSYTLLWSHIHIMMMKINSIIIVFSIYLVFSNIMHKNSFILTFYEKKNYFFFFLLSRFVWHTRTHSSERYFFYRTFFIGNSFFSFLYINITNQRQYHLFKYPSVSIYLKYTLVRKVYNLELLAFF